MIVNKPHFYLIYFVQERTVTGRENKTVISQYTIFGPPPIQSILYIAMGKNGNEVGPSLS